MRLTSAPTIGAAPQKTVAGERFTTLIPKSSKKVFVVFDEQSAAEYPRSSADAVVTTTRLANAIAPRLLMIFMVHPSNSSEWRKRLRKPPLIAQRTHQPKPDYHSYTRSRRSIG